MPLLGADQLPDRADRDDPAVVTGVAQIIASPVASSLPRRLDPRHDTRIVETITTANPNVEPFMAGLARQMQDLTPDTAEQQQMSMSLLNQLVTREAMTMTYADSFLLIAGIFLLTLTVLPFSQRIRPTAGSGGGGH